MNTKEMQEKLRSLGLAKNFRPYAEQETSALMLATRKPVQIVGGLLKGCEIVLEGGLFRVWTGRKRLAHELAQRHGLRVRLLDGEAELWVPAALADELLPKFGAKVKRICDMTTAQRKNFAAKMLAIKQNSAESMPKNSKYRESEHLLKCVSCGFGP